MFEAQYLFKDDAVYSPWMAREGDTVRGSFDVVELSGVNLEIELVEKNREDTGDGIARAQKITATTTGIHDRGWGAVKELVRFRFKAAGGSNNYDYALFRSLTSIWFDSVKA